MLMTFSYKPIPFSSFHYELTRMILKGLRRKKLQMDLSFRKLRKSHQMKPTSLTIHPPEVRGATHMSASPDIERTYRTESA